MKAKDMREKSGADLVELEKSLAREAFQARFKNFTNRLDDTSSLRKSRRDIARVKTILAEREQIGGGPDAAHAAHAPVKPTPSSAKAATPKAKAAAKSPAKTAKKTVEASK